MGDAAHHDVLESLRSRIRTIERTGRDAAPSRTSTRPIPGVSAAQDATGCIDVAPAAYEPSTADDAFQRIVRLVSVRDRSQAELARRLSQEGYESEAAAHALERAARCGLVDDLRFADAFVRGRISQGRGIAGIERELSEYGIEARSLDDWPEAFFPNGENDELERALRILEKKPPRAKNVRDAAYRRLVGKGFSSDVAQRAARRWVERPCD